jgi:hypothetical protein
MPGRGAAALIKRDMLSECSEMLRWYRAQLMRRTSRRSSKSGQRETMVRAYGSHL